MWIAAAGAGSWSQALFWLAVFAGMIGLAVIVLAGVRRWSRERDDSMPEGFTLQDLRELRDQGAIDDREYEAARAVMLGREAAEANGKDRGRGQDAAAGRR